MKLACDTGPFMVGGFSRPETFRLIRKAGYSYADINPDAFKPHEATANDIKEIRKCLDDNGLGIASVLPLISISSPDNAERRKGVESWKRAVDGAHELGAKELTTEMSGDRTRKEESVAAFRKSMDELLPVIQKAGMHLSAECHPGDFIESSDATAALVREINHPSLGYIFCFPHTFVMGKHAGLFVKDQGRDAIDMIRHAGDVITFVHVADSLKQNRIIAPPETKPHCHLVPGRGEIDWEGMLRALKETRYDGMMTVVLWSHTTEPLEASTETNRAMHELCSKAGIALED